jgi:hypothetical protein
MRFPSSPRRTEYRLYSAILMDSSLDSRRRCPLSCAVASPSLALASYASGPPPRPMRLFRWHSEAGSRSHTIFGGCKNRPSRLCQLVPTRWAPAGGRAQATRRGPRAPTRWEMLGQTSRSCSQLGRSGFHKPCANRRWIAQRPIPSSGACGSSAGGRLVRIQDVGHAQPMTEMGAKLPIRSLSEFWRLRPRHRTSADRT